MTPSIAEPFVVACHDAGAANLIIAWIRAEGVKPLARPVLAGPARALWQAAWPGAPLWTWEDAWDGARALLSGTGWSSDWEVDARRDARRRGLPAIAVIDHWVNYRERFIRGGSYEPPDDVWVADADAARLARKTFPDARIVQIPNYYLADQVRHIPPAPSGGDVLFVLEPIRTTWGDGRAGEWQALDFFMQARECAGIPPDTPIRLRPHPSDPPGKYDAWLRAHPGSPAVSLDEAPALADALAPARWVVGCQSMAMVVGLEAGRTVVCALPPEAPACPLPHAGILHLAKIAVRP